MDDLKEKSKESKIKDTRKPFRSSLLEYDRPHRVYSHKYNQYRFKYDETGKVVVVPNGEFDVYAETQSHAKEVGFENIVHKLPDGQVYVSPTTSSGQGFYGDTTRFSDDPNESLSTLERMQSSKKALDDTYGEKDWNKISSEELTKVIDDYIASKKAKKEDSTNE